MIDGTLVLTFRLDLYDKAEREFIAENLKALVEGRIERWPATVAAANIDEEFFDNPH
jgi:hypothetical protein